jgi:hypothetical protein
MTTTDRLEFRRNQVRAVQRHPCDMADHLSNLHAEPECRHVDDGPARLT